MSQAHYSTKKSANWLGIGTNNLVIIKTDEHGRMLAGDLNEQIERVQHDGRRPFFVNATAGTTVLGAFDRLHEIADICERHHVWLHVDACLGGSVIVSQRHSHLVDGIDRADSLAWNPHKSLGVPLQCSMFLIRERGALHECNSTAAKYLFQQDKFYDVSYDTGDKSMQCGRKVDVFKFWLMLKARGMNGMETLLDRAMETSAYLTEQIRRRDGFRLIIADGDGFDYTNVCFWFVPPRMRGQEESDAWWQELYKVAPALKQAMIMAGTMMVGYSPLQGFGNFLRMVLAGYPAANRTDVDFVLDELERLGQSL